MNGEILHMERYVSVILPVKYGGEISYFLPKIFEVFVGSRVRVDFAGKIYTGVVRKFLSQEEIPSHTPDGKEINYKPVLAVEELPVVLPQEMELWEKVAQYYMCTVGEVYKAAYPALQVKQESVKPRKKVEDFLKAVQDGKDVAQEKNIPQLSGVQQKAFEEIKGSFEAAPGKPVLLRGVTGSGKTEIYISLALECLRQGKSVLYMVPEIAISKQLQGRLKKVFGERLLTFHSKQTAAEKARIHKILVHNAANAFRGGEKSCPQAEQAEICREENSAVVVLGTRSSLFLPYSNMGLVIVDEEHDSSYKQTEPAPRYQAKDTAIMLAQIHGCNVLLGSATPSFESEYNCLVKRFALVELKEKFYGGEEPQVEIVDTVYAYKTRQMVGNFSQKLINEIKRTVGQGYQVLVFRNRRSYSPIVECEECGEIPKCPHCNVHLSYHKYNNTLRCHYCEYIAQFTGVCKHCGTASFKYRGAGTEKLEEELAALLPQARIARFDADVAKSKREEEKVIKDFAAGEIDILVGTQMISKGFDFEKLKLVAVLQADTILGVQDFRADEKAVQLLSQLMGRTGRRGERGKIIIQTSQKEHPVLVGLQGGKTDVVEMVFPLTGQLLGERRQYGFAPYVRMVKIVVKHTDTSKLDEICQAVKRGIEGSPELQYKELTGPFTPQIDKIRGEWIKCFYIKFARDSRLVRNKELLGKCIAKIKGSHSIILDVDPL